MITLRLDTSRAWHRWQALIRLDSGGHVVGWGFTAWAAIRVALESYAEITAWADIEI